VSIKAGEVHLARLRRAVGLLARSPDKLAAAHRYPRAVHAQIERRRNLLGRSRRRDHGPITIDLRTKRLGRTLDALGVDVYSGQLREQLAALGEAHQSADCADHPRHPRRQRAVVDAKVSIAWAEAPLARRALVIGTLEPEFAEHARDLLAMAPGVACLSRTPPARQLRPRVVRGVGVQALLDGPSSDPQNASAQRHLDRLEVDLRADRPAYERFDFRPDFRVETRFEPPFLAASVEAACGESSSASAQRSHASQYASSRSRNPCPAAT